MAPIHGKRRGFAEPCRRDALSFDVTTGVAAGKLDTSGMAPALEAALLAPLVDVMLGTGDADGRR